jgi:hypothetical protein
VTAVVIIGRLDTRIIQVPPCGENIFLASVAKLRILVKMLRINIQWQAKAPDVASVTIH